MRKTLVGFAAISMFTGHAAAQTRIWEIGTLSVGVDSATVMASDAGFVLLFGGTLGDGAYMRLDADALDRWLDSTRAIVALPASDGVSGTVVYGSPHRDQKLSRKALVLTRTMGGSTPQITLHMEEAGDWSVDLPVTAAGFSRISEVLQRALLTTRVMTPGMTASDHTAGDVPEDAERVYYSFQVERQARQIGGNPQPPYPHALEWAHVEGGLLAQFVVDTTGRVETSTFRALKVTNELFVEAVKQVLPAWKFRPAETGGHKVKQLVQMPFSFKVP